MGSTLRQRATSGLVWSAIERFGQQASVFIIQIILARILAPEQFGLIAMVAVVMRLSGIIVDAGFSQALVQRKNIGDADISTVFYFNLFVSCAMALVICLLAPYVSNFYGFSELTLILRVLTIRLVISAFGSVQGAIFARKLAFKKIFWVTLPSTVVSGIISIIMAYNGFGVWALVWQSIIRAFLLSCVYWAYSSWRPKFVFDIKCLKEMFPYGSRLAMTSFLHQGFQNLYVLVIGKVFSASDLGYFQRARSLQRLPVDNIHGIISRVTFPLFSSIQDDPPRMKRGMCKALQFSTLLVFPGMALLAAIAEPLVLVLIGEKWLPSVPYLKWLCFVGALFPLHSMNINLLSAIGRSDKLLRLEIIKKSILILNIFITYRFGIIVMIYGWGISSVIGLFINTYYTKIYIDYRFSEQVMDVFPAIGIALCVFSINHLAVNLLNLNEYMKLLVSLFGGSVILTCGLKYFIRNELKKDICSMLTRVPFLKWANNVIM
ncbi:lipopolysaccharide biosynthesis protein [Kiritimatiellaeota bacterium B1221]|nr:lipopolysaccharide biosynthesis protein [Kiritimatiellaeota bacterium B1221]